MSDDYADAEWEVAQRALEEVKADNERWMAFVRGYGAAMEDYGNGRSQFETVEDFHGHLDKRYEEVYSDA